jgi:thiol-disulfide isomerase/thioredoxin
VNVTEHKRRISLPIKTIIIICAALLIMVGLVLALLPKTSFGYQERIDSDEIMEEYPPVEPMEVDLPAPSLTLLDTEGKPVSLNDYYGQVVLVNVWAIWCPPCRAELPILQEYYKDHRKQNFLVVGIDAGDEVEDILYHVKFFKLTFPNWQDPNKDATRAFEVLSLPSSYVIDRNSRIRLTWMGAANRESLEQYVTPFLEK